MTKAKAIVATTSDATDLINAITDGFSEAIAPVAKADKPVARKGKTQPKAQPSDSEQEAAAGIAQAPAKVAKVEPVKELYHGFEVIAGTDTTVLDNATTAARLAMAKVDDKDQDLLSAYLEIGGFLFEVSASFKSPKLFGQFVAKELPESAKLDPALRSNCKWLFEALNNPEADHSDLLSVLNVNRIEDFKSGNPTVIRREYKATKDAAIAKAKLEADGIDPDDAEAVEAATKADKAKSKAKAEQDKQDLLAAITYFMSEMAVAKKSAILDRVGPMLTSCIMGGSETVAAMLITSHLEYLDEQEAEDNADSEE